MVATNSEETIYTIHIAKEIQIAAPIEIAFEALLAELGPESEMPDGTAFPMKIEPRPGGLWYRDLGDDSGHLWGHVQVIKPPKLLEISGPMFMSYPALNFIQYRLHDEGDNTRVEFAHRALGLISKEHREGVAMGWEYGLNRIREIAEKRSKSR